MIVLTGIVIAKNESERIQQALKTLSFCDEILLIDNDSSDATADLAKEMGARVVSNLTRNDFAYLRNFASAEAQGEWLLYLDADEELSPNLRANIRHEITDPKADAYYLRRRDHFMGQVLEHGEVSKVYERGIIRLMKKNTGQWHGSIHEEWKTQNKISSVDGFIEHYPHQSIIEFLRHIKRYSQIRATELQKAGIRTNAGVIIMYPLGKFLYTYIIKGGFKDGAAGFIYSFMMSFHSFLVRSTLFIIQKAYDKK